MLATLISEPFDDENWLYEIKWDGYRAIAEIESGEVKLYSRNNNPFNKKYPGIVKSLEYFDKDMVLDGEIVILNEQGKASFQLLQVYGKSEKGTLVYYVFDILHYEGKNLTNIPLEERKMILKDVLPDIPNIRFNDHILKEGKAFYRLAGENELEGIIAKNIHSKYLTNNRSKEWLKLKIKKRQEAIIGGYTRPKGTRSYFGALILGVYNDKKELIYIGHSGGGFSEDDLKNIYKMLKSLEIKTCPFKIKPKTNTPATWVSPELICEVEFSEWTDEGLMRHPVFLALREDKKADNVKKELPDENASPAKDSKLKEEKIQSRLLRLTNLNKIYWPGEGYTKGDVINYYKNIGPYILPYLKGRPESLLRHPEGINGESFFQKDISQFNAGWLLTQNIFSESNEKDIKYLICNDEETLIYMANLGCIEINPWFSRIEKLEYPDYFVIDLDPVEIEFDKVVETALAVKEVLDKAKAESYCKTSGATGLHIYVPLGAKYNYDTAKEFAHIIAKLANAKVPKITSLERSPSKRNKKVYLDFLQNRKGQTLAAPYSIRPRPGAPVSTPLVWSEVKPGLDPSDFNIKNIFKRLYKKGDLFKQVLGPGIDINKCINNLQNKR
ncbi:MAG TPA: DNA ligase D [Ignavibacteriaceae bacterium]|nr:DNA ligase D [Ignavibacteriaceae bacterium]